MTKKKITHAAARPGRGPTATRPTKIDTHGKRIKSNDVVHLSDVILQAGTIEAPQVILERVVLAHNLSIKGAQFTLTDVWQEDEFDANQGLSFNGSEGIISRAYLVGNNNDQVTIGGGCGRIEIASSTIATGANLYQDPSNPHPVHKDAFDVGLVDLLVFTDTDVTGSMNSAIWGKATFQFGSDTAMRAFEATGSRFSCRRVGDDTHRNPHIIYLGAQCATAKIANCEFDALPLSSLRLVTGVTSLDMTSTTYYTACEDRQIGDTVEVNWVDRPY